MCGKSGEVEKTEMVPEVQESVSVDENGVLTVTLNNLCTEAEKEIELVLTKKKPAHVSARIVHGKMQAYNSFEEPERVTEEDFTDFRLTDRGLTFTIPACSVLMFRVEMEG